MEVKCYPERVLTRTARRIEARDGLDLHALMAEMIQTMEEEHGVGLAAPQIGQSIRFFIAMDTTTGEVRGFANPQIVSGSLAREVGAEGCLSFPGLYADVERHKSVVLRFQDVNLEQRKETFEGFYARVIQHELDHLNGVLLINRAIGDLYTIQQDDEDEAGEQSEAVPAAEED